MQHWIKIYKKGKTSDTQSARIHPFISFAVLLHSELSIPFCSFSLFLIPNVCQNSKEKHWKRREHILFLSLKKETMKGFPEHPLLAVLIQLTKKKPPFNTPTSHPIASQKEEKKKGRRTKKKKRKRRRITRALLLLLPKLKKEIQK